MESEDLLDLIAELRRKNAEFCVVTVVRTQDATFAKAGAKAVVAADGTLHGFIGGGCVQGAVRRVAAEVLGSGTPRLIRIKPREEVVEPLDADGVELHKSGCPSGGTVDLFIEPLRLAPRLIVCGASPVALALIALGARMGYRVAAAAKPEDHERLGEADQRVAGFELTGLGVREGDYLVVATQGQGDYAALKAAIASPAAYVALVGSRKKAESLCARLREDGVPEARIARLRAPAGLDIAAIEPGEIALSILGEIVQVRRGAIREAPGETASDPAA